MRFYFSTFANWLDEKETKKKKKKPVFKIFPNLRSRKTFCLAQDCHFGQRNSFLHCWRLLTFEWQP